MLNLFRSNKDLIPNLVTPKDQTCELIEEYKENDRLDYNDSNRKDLDFPLPKIEDRYLKIDGKNELESIVDNYLSIIYDNLINYKYNQPVSFDEIFKY